MAPWKPLSFKEFDALEKEPLDYSTGTKFTQKYQCELGHVDIRVLEFNAKEVFIRASCTLEEEAENDLP